MDSKAFQVQLFSASLLNGLHSESEVERMESDKFLNKFMSKVVILAGGYGTRLSEYTENIPKPMVPIGGIPMIEHIMNYYSAFGF